MDQSPSIPNVQIPQVIPQPQPQPPPPPPPVVQQGKRTKKTTKAAAAAAAAAAVAAAAAAQLQVCFSKLWLSFATKLETHYGIVNLSTFVFD